MEIEFLLQEKDPSPACVRANQPSKERSHSKCNGEYKSHKPCIDGIFAGWNHLKEDGHPKCINTRASDSLKGAKYSSDNLGVSHQHLVKEMSEKDLQFCHGLGSTTCCRES